MCITAHVWSSEDKPQASDYGVSLEDQTQVTRSERQALLPTEPSHQPPVSLRGVHVRGKSPQGGVSATWVSRASPPPKHTHKGTLVGPILPESHGTNHSCSDFNTAMAMLCPEDSTLHSTLEPMGQSMCTVIRASEMSAPPRADECEPEGHAWGTHLLC